MPDSAEVKVVSIGLFDAAVATGSCAMPATEPGPVGFWAAYSEQPGPIRSAAGSALADEGAELTVADTLAEVALLVPWDAGLLLEQPATPAIAIAARAAAATDLA